MSQRKDAIENLLSLHRACPEAVVWARRYATLEEVWEALTAPDWALWALETFGYRGDRQLRLFAAACARRCSALWSDPQCVRAVELAAKAAVDAAGAADLAAGYLATRKAAGSIVDRPDYSEAMAAAAAAAAGALRASAVDAAKEASRESARAVAWDPDSAASWDEEGAWQCDELRRIVGDDIHAVIAEARRSTRGALHVL